MENTDYLALKEENAKLKEELKRAKYSSEKYKKLFDVSADALSIIDLSSGKFIECNQAAIDMHGVLSKDNFLNLSPADISPEFQPCGRSSQEMAGEYMSECIAKGAKSFQWVHSKLDGSEFQCLVSLTAIPLEDGYLVLAVGRDISNLIATQEDLTSALEESKRFKQAYIDEKEKFEKFVDLAPVGIAINRLADGKFTYINETFSEFTGYSVDELNNMDYWQLTPQKYAELETEQLNSMATKGSYGPYQKEYIHKKGHTYPVLLSGIKITATDGADYIWSVVQDISEQQQIESQLRTAKERADEIAFRMQLANDSASIGVWELDLLSDELVWDEWMYKLYGVSPSQFASADEAWQQGIHPEDKKEAKLKLQAAILNDAVYNAEYRVVRPGGEICTLKASAEVIRDDSGTAVKVIGVNYDVTAKVEALATAEQARLEAERSSKAKGDFLANMSHEIRTPMNGILGGLQLLQRAQLDHELQAILDNAYFSARSLLTVINDILDYSKIESNSLVLEESPFSMVEVIDSIRYDLDSIVSNKNIEFIVSYGQDFRDGWLGDLVRVKQIILNLSSNAVKFTDEGQVKIIINELPHNGADALNISVIDSGIGMSEDAQKRVFERFSQADSSTTRKYGGTGLGMSITVSLVEMMGGDISLNSAVGQGTKVNVTLPLKRAKMVSYKEKSKQLAVPQLSGSKILIAEDNQINQVLIQSMLKETNAELKVVENGKLAVAAVEQSSFDLVLMDIHMPEMDGTEAQLKIRSLTPELPVIALTANVMANDVHAYLQQGFVAHIAKPIDIGQLYAALNNYIVAAKTA